jgi:hypothetical protein
MNRRVVLRQAVKLSYSAPLIAASMKFADFKDAGASFPCTPERAAACGPCMTCASDLDCFPIEGCIPD